MTKTVALSEQAYRSLARLKRPGQSFSDVVVELVANRRPSIREVAGVLSEDDEYWGSFAAERRKARRVSKDRVRLEGD